MNLVNIETNEMKTGQLTFVTPEGESTASAGDLMTVPPGAVLFYTLPGGFPFAFLTLVC
jgi:ethanolamine utilization protein EutQ (cupin superfamily)